MAMCFELVRQLMKILAVYIDYIREVALWGILKKGTSRCAEMLSFLNYLQATGDLVVNDKGVIYLQNETKTKNVAP